MQMVIGRRYRTGNGSIVEYLGLTKPYDHDVIIIESTHPGGCVGVTYWEVDHPRGGAWAIKEALVPNDVAFLPAAVEEVVWD